MKNRSQLPAELDAHLRDLLPSGYALGVNFRNFTPEHYFTTVPEAWEKLYISKRLAMFDPIVAWSIMNKGRSRWSEVRVLGISSKSTAVMKRASTHGFKYGAVFVATEEGTSGLKSVLSGGRPDRELTEIELDTIEEIFNEARAMLNGRLQITDKEASVLTLAAQGYSQSEMAQSICISRETVKRRLETSRDKLGAENTTHAVALALSRKLIVLPDDPKG